MELLLWVYNCLAKHLLQSWWQLDQSVLKITFNMYSKCIIALNDTRDVVVSWSVCLKVGCFFFSPLSWLLAAVGGNIGPFAAKLFAAYWGKWITGKPFLLVTSKQKVSPFLLGPGGERDRLRFLPLVFVVVVVVELNTPLALLAW